MSPQVRGFVNAIVGAVAVVLLTTFWAELRWPRYALVAAVVVWLAWMAREMRFEGRRLDRASLGRCARCGYDLAGHDPPGRCPECGQPFGIAP